MKRCGIETAFSIPVCFFHSTLSCLVTIILSSLLLSPVGVFLIPSNLPLELPLSSPLPLLPPFRFVRISMKSVSFVPLTHLSLLPSSSENTNVTLTPFSTCLLLSIYHTVLCDIQLPTESGELKGKGLVLRIRLK